MKFGNEHKPTADEACHAAIVIPCDPVAVIFSTIGEFIIEARGTESAFAFFGQGSHAGGDSQCRAQLRLARCQRATGNARGVLAQSTAERSRAAQRRF